MLKVTQEMGFYDFVREYHEILPEDREAQEIIFESLESCYDNGIDDMTIRDYIRFQLNISTQDELLEMYNIIDEEELKELENDDIHIKIEEYLDYNTYFLGSYEDYNGKMIYLYDEF